MFLFIVAATGLSACDKDQKLAANEISSFFKGYFAQKGSGVANNNPELFKMLQDLKEASAANSDNLSQEAQDASADAAMQLFINESAMFIKKQEVKAAVERARANIAHSHHVASIEPTNLQSVQPKVTAPKVKEKVLTGSEKRAAARAEKASSSAKATADTSQK